jgi:hypothetical protein
VVSLHWRLGRSMYMAFWSPIAMGCIYIDGRILNRGYECSAYVLCLRRICGWDKTRAEVGECHVDPLTVDYVLPKVNRVPSH